MSRRLKTIQPSYISRTLKDWHSFVVFLFSGISHFTVTRWLFPPRNRSCTRIPWYPGTYVFHYTVSRWRLHPTLTKEPTIFMSVVKIFLEILCFVILQMHFTRCVRFFVPSSYISVLDFCLPFYPTSLFFCEASAIIRFSYATNINNNYNFCYLVYLSNISVSSCNRSVYVILVLCSSLLSLL